MTAKEKAKHLALKFTSSTDVVKPNIESILKALLCVNEILEGMGNQINGIDSLDTIYWLKVKKELENFN